VYSYPAQLSGNLFTHFIQQSVVLYSTQHQLFWVTDGRLLQPHAQPPFSVNRNHQRNLADSLVSVGERYLCLRRALKKTKPADMMLPNKLLHRSNVISPQIGVSPHHEQLPQPFVRAEAVKYGINPGSFLRVGLIQISLISRLCRNGEADQDSQQQRCCRRSQSDHSTRS